ncbi:MAG: endonuclease III [Thermonema sp.]|uniref:endonuclease III n=1 Tax=Thermonema sp. TaxID=2231181 RepID=UPI0021DE177C|nr:endonuclease III [Thermonema sp.]GIV40112.1 MAG: endonuclease III [Thermonema sp.]
MKREERYQKILEYFQKTQPDAQTELRYETPYQLLVAVILSAQCTDERVNQVTPALFERYPTPQDLANAKVEEVYELIKSISYPNNKAKHLVGMAKMLVEQYGGEVPDTMEALVKLPGVGRKTANVILSVIYDQPAMAVDTHVFRVSKRLGLVEESAKTPLEVEQELVKHIPKELVARAHHWLILHGRYVCLARKPKCDACGLRAYCLYYEQQVAPFENKLK